VKAQPCRQILMHGVVLFGDALDMQVSRIVGEWRNQRR